MIAHQRTTVLKTPTGPRSVSEARPPPPPAHSAPPSTPRVTAVVHPAGAGLQLRLQRLPLLLCEHGSFGSEHLQLSIEERVAQRANTLTGCDDVCDSRLIGLQDLAKVAHRDHAVAIEPGDLVRLICGNLVEGRELISGEVQRFGKLRLMPPPGRGKHVQHSVRRTSA